MPKISLNRRFSQLETLLKQGFASVQAQIKSESEQLGLMVKQGFDHVDQRFEQVDQRFAQIDARFVQIDLRFAKIDLRFAGIDQRLDSIDLRLNSMDRQLRNAVYQPELAAVNTRVTRLERHTGLKKS